MPVVLPFTALDIKNQEEITPENTPRFGELAPELQEAARQHHHLLVYLNMLPVAETGLPEYFPKLSRKAGDNKKPNCIYPTQDENVFVHVLYNATDRRNSYIPIEHSLVNDYLPLVREVEKKLLELRWELTHLQEDIPHDKQLLKLVERVTQERGQAQAERKAGLRHYMNRGGIRCEPLKVSKRELEGIKYLYVRDKHGLGVLQAMIVDPYIEDISCSGLGNVFIEHKVFKALRSALCFKTDDELDGFVLWLAERIRKPITFRNPISDATLPDGSRINIVFGKAVSKRGSNFTIRKFPGTPTSIFELVDFGSLSYQMLAYLSLVIGNGMNVFVSGETASGKTTLLNAVTTFIHPLAKIVTIEDTPELQVPHKNWIREVVQTTKVDENSKAVNMYDLLRAALRQRPNQILVGEIRGPEGNVAFQAMQTGHAVMATFHAASVEKLIQRMTGSPISVPKAYVDNLNVVVLTSMVKLPNGKMGRRVLGIFEIVSYDPVYESFTYVEIFHWNEVTDVFEFPGYMTSDILENRIAHRMGLAAKNKHHIYNDLERRAKILENLHKKQHITDFYEVLQVLHKAQREGLF